MPIPSFPSELLRRVQALLPVLALVCTICPAIADEYALEPGDVVRLQIAGIEQFSAVAQVANDGFVSLPRFGRVEVEGRTLAQVRAILKDRVGSITFRMFDVSGLASVREITPDDIVLEVERYRDVAVSGFVTRPGMIPFSPGMTVRAAIAAAGGILRENASVAGADLPGTATRLAEIGRLTYARAGKLAEIWRLESSLGENVPVPGAAELGVDATVADALVGLQKEILETANENHQGAVELLDSIDQLSATRAKSLGEQQKIQTEALDMDRQEFARTKALLERGLVVADRVHEMSRMQYLSEAQLLQTQGEIERLQIQRTQSEGELRKLDADRRAADLAALAEARRALSDIESQLSGAQMALGLSAPAASPDAMSSPVAVEAVVHRGTGDKAVEIRPGLDSLVQPGDVVEIVLENATAAVTASSRPGAPPGAVR